MLARLTQTRAHSDRGFTREEPVQGARLKETDDDGDYLDDDREDAEGDAGDAGEEACGEQVDEEVDIDINRL
jgi:hypothetical protein